MREHLKILKVDQIYQDYAYTLLTLIIGSKTTSSPKFEFEELGMVKRTQKEVWLKIECEPGDYVAYVKEINKVDTPWRRCANEFGFSIYGPEEVSLWLNTKSGVNREIIHDLLLQRCIQRGPEFAYISDICYKYELDNGGFGYFYFENRSASQIYYIIVDLMEPMLNCKFSRFF